MKHLKFKKGDFIKESASRNSSFAVFEGDVYESTVKGGPNEYSLLCFYNPEHYTQDSNGNYKQEFVFECDLDNETCDYYIDDNDMPFWRCCTKDEIEEALKFLAEKKHIAYDEKTFTFRKLKDGERLSFEAPKPTGACGGNISYNRGSESGLNPFYRGHHGPGTVGNTPVTPTAKLITRAVDDEWEQKEPMCNMTEEHIEMVMEQCEKLKYAFNSYSVSTGFMRYPNDGSQVPVRYPYGMGEYGMGAYDDWGEYD